jgi:hypothetical protein
MQTPFIKKLNELIELHKIATKSHIEFVKELSTIFNDIRAEIKLSLQSFQTKEPKQKLDLNNDALPEHIKTYLEFKEINKNYQKDFGQLIDQTNTVLGAISNHWGSYLEDLAVKRCIVYLKQDWQVHTCYQKYNKTWGKNKQVELDMIALSDTHIYITEVKNQLNDNALYSILKNIDKINEHLEEFAHLKKQLIVICLYADEATVEKLRIAGVWILRYMGFDTENPVHDFEVISRA